MSYGTYENPMVIGAEVENAKCAHCGKPLDDDTEETSDMGFPICLKCAYWEESE